MGKLLDEVLAIHKSKMNHDISKYEIEKNIEIINKRILERAEHGDSSLTINFENVNDAITTAYSSIIYYYIVNELDSVKYIMEKISKYYTDEGFEVINGQFRTIIGWGSKLFNIE